MTPIFLFLSILGFTGSQVSSSAPRANQASSPDRESVNTLAERELARREEAEADSSNTSDDDQVVARSVQEATSASRTNTEQQSQPVIIEQILAEPDDEPASEQQTVEQPIVTAQVSAPGTQEQTTAGGAVEPTAAQGTVSIIGGRVTTIDPGEDVASVRILSDLEHGHATVNPDNTVAVVMTLSDFIGTQSLSYEVTFNDGSSSVESVDLNVVAGPQQGGWGTGEAHYMLATDENDNVVVEHGDVHTKVYISGSPQALSLADIAGREGISVESVTGKWLASNGTYGTSEDTALAADAGMELWRTVTYRGSETSNWLLFEKGYSYEDLGRIVNRDANGESELHPLYVGAWGEGSKPEINSRMFQFQESSDNLVIQGLNFTEGVGVLEGNNIIFDDIASTGNAIILQSGTGITVRNSAITEVSRDAPKDGGDWTSGDRAQGMYVDRTDGLLLEGLLFDMNGWREGYDPGLDGSSPMPPNMFNQNLYIQNDNEDVTLRDTISMRAASFGAQVRSGGFVEDNVFLDNNAGVTSIGGDYRDAGPIGQYTLYSGNIVTSAGHKDTDGAIGALSRGLENDAELTTLVDNIVAHLADPNSNELDWKTTTHFGLRHTEADPYYDDTIVWNWEGGLSNFSRSTTITEQNAEGLNAEVLDQTTIQRFTADLLNKPDATISDLAAYLKAQAAGSLDDVVDADLIIRFFQEGFGVAADIRTEADTVRFVPTDLSDGVRWDNRLNWETNDLPGTVSGDSVDLGGNTVVFGSNATIDTLTFGEGGELHTYGGKLEVDSGVSGGGKLDVEGASQVWIAGTDPSDTLDITSYGGRVVNTDHMQQTNIDVSGKAEAILATDNATWEVDDGHKLSIDGANAKVGFDGSNGGTAILDLDKGGVVEFLADGTLGTIEEFRSGAFGDAPNVLSGIDLEGSALEIDLSGLSPDAGTSFTLMSADEIAGRFGSAKITGLNSGSDATLVVDYANDKVILQLASGSGQFSFEERGAENDAQNGALWDALTADHGVISESGPEDDEIILEIA